MPSLRSPVVALFLVLAAVSGAATTACFDPCTDEKRNQCESIHMDLDTATCDCAPRPTMPPVYPSTPPVTSCTSDANCAVYAHCDLDSFTCSLSECKTDLDCNPGVPCSVDEAWGIGTCMCAADAGCAPVDHARCTVDTDCRADEGATCRAGWCHGP